MQHGEIKWYDAARGYGFVVPANGGRDVFIHVRAIEQAGLTTLTKGQVVQYEAIQGRDGRVSAENLKLVQG